MIKIRTPKIVAAFLTGGLLLAAGVGVILTAHASDQPSAKVKSMGLVIDDHPLARDARPGVSYADVVKKVMPSVVKVEVTTAAKESSVEMPGIQMDPFFRQFFGNQFGGGRQRIISPPMHGLGSGVIVTKDGYILTNNHVVDDADKVKITLQDGREFIAKVIGKDKESDVAVVKIDAHDLPAITLADSSKIEVGDVVLAVGNPFGLAQTVTMGIISATGRVPTDMDTGRLAMNLKYQDFIQTDAAINPGNSGGALVDTDGRLIGVNTAIFSRSGGNEGIGLAIPTDLAREVMVSLVKDGKVTRGYLGVIPQPLTPVLAREFDLKSTKGALIGEVEPSSPAAKAGLKNGDVILQFNGKTVADDSQLRLEVAAVAPGEKVPVRIWRDGAAKTVDVLIKEVPGEAPLAKNGSSESDSNDTLNGVAVSDLNAQMRRQFSLPPKIEGAVVTQVEPGSAAADAGLKEGDVILEINKHPVRSADDAVKLTSNVKDKITLLRVWSNNGTHYLVVDESKAG
ncbi:MAG: DegQ family serine endoprotease [Verrucomicrobiota bacterium]|jgi:serine protease Do